MEVHPFFLECSEYELGSRRKQLQQLALGYGGLIVNSIFVYDKQLFKIPDAYSDCDRNVLVNMLWPLNTDYHRLQTAIKESSGAWKNAKKKNKLRLVDNYVLKRVELSKREKIVLKANITMAIILKLLCARQIEYSSYEIENISGISSTCSIQELLSGQQ